jgi:beta-lactamase superfamily II metal-dependent hydrolase
VPADALGRIEEGPPGRDNSEANGSSIAMLVDYEGTRALLTGDAHAAVLAGSLTRLGATTEKQLAVDLWKLAHHGSWANLTEELFALVRTPRYLISTNGVTHEHPHARTLDYIIDNHRGRRRPELVFNYRCSTTERWAAGHPSAAKFTANFPTGSVLVL